MPEELCLLVCPFIKQEIQAAVEQEGFKNVTVAAYPARCQGIPLQWAEIAKSVPSKEKYHARMIMGSTCLDGLDEPSVKPGGYQILRLEYCFSLLANKDLLNYYFKQGNYLLTPGWLAGWRRQLEDWGFESSESNPQVRNFFKESAKKLLLVDTGVEGTKISRLQEFAEFVDLDYDVLPVGLDHLRLFISNVFHKWHLETDISEKAAAALENQVGLADFSMIMNVFGELAKVVSEADTIEHILGLFNMLFAPQELYYLTLTDGVAGQLHSYRTQPANDKTIRNRMTGLKTKYAWTSSGNGFILQISYNDQVVGIAQIDEITFPQYKEHYLNLALSLVDVCGLAIDNARKYQLLATQKNNLAQALSELQEALQQLVEAEKKAALGKLVAGVAHEINTPVGNCLLAASTILDRNKQLAKLYENSEMTRSDVERFLQFSTESAELLMSNLQRTGDLIQSFKRVSVDQTADQPRKFFLNSYLQDVIRSLNPNFKSKEIDVVTDCPEDIELNSYPGAYAQIISNLVLNSLRHGFRDKNNGKITITAGLYKHKLRLEYQDNGCGISPDILTKIFDPFYTTNKQTGSGLGLHIVYNIVTHKLQGRIICKSKPGGGTAFKITVPLNQGENHEK